MTANIIQWNINRLIKKKNDLQIIINKHNPIAICLQETNLIDNYHTPQFKNYNSFFYNRKQCARASGGVAILTNTNYPCREIPIQSNLEVIAVSIKIESEITLCNIYLPNQTNFNHTDLNNIINQLPKPYIITGDFNSHSPYWGSQKTDQRGKSIEKVLEDDNIMLLNTGAPTRMNPATGLFSAIDLSLSSTSLGQRVLWSVLPEIYDSDHIPILIEFLTSHNPTKTVPSKWKLKNPDWAFFN